MILLWNSADMVVQCELIDGESSTKYTWHADRSLARDMLVYLRDRLAEHGKTLNDIEGIGVFRGPGSFTGLRIGLTVLNTLAHARHIPVVGATGDSWRADVLERISTGKDDRLVLPEYGTPAHVTSPRK